MECGDIRDVFEIQEIEPVGMYDINILFYGLHDLVGYNIYSFGPDFHFRLFFGSSSKIDRFFTRRYDSAIHFAISWSYQDRFMSQFYQTFYQIKNNSLCSAILFRRHRNIRG